MHRLGDDGLHPVGNWFPFGDRIADILPVNLYAKLFELLCDTDDIADFVIQLTRANVQNISTHATRYLFSGNGKEGGILAQGQGDAA